jgi:hypothetical protein
VTSRDTILAAVRANQPTPTPPLPEVPLFKRTEGSLLEEFQEALMRIGESSRASEAAITLIFSFDRSSRAGDRHLFSDRGGGGDSNPDPQRQSHRFGRC